MSEKGYIRVMDKVGRTLGVTQDWQIIPDGYNFIIFQDGNLIRVKNGRTGKIEYSSGKLEEAFNYVAGKIKNYSRVAIIGEEMYITSPLILQDKIGVTIVIQGMIVNDGTDYTIKLIGTREGVNKLNRIIGGHIRGSGTNNGILIRNGFKNKIIDVHIESVQKGITIENTDNLWSESNSIENVTFEDIRYYDIGFEVGENGASSFVNTRVSHVSMNVQVYGIYIGSGANVNLSVFENLHGWATKDNAHFVHCEGSMTGSTFISPYFEDVNSLYTGEVMFYGTGNQGSYVVINPRAINIQEKYGGTNNRAFIETFDHFINFANTSPAVYGGLSNYYDDMFCGWRLDGDQRRVLNRFNRSRSVNTLWSWADVETWKTVLELQKTGRLESADKIKANEGLITKQMVGDYGGDFANFTPPSGEGGQIILAVDTNPTAPGARLFVYANGSWRYVNLNQF